MSFASNYSVTHVLYSGLGGHSAVLFSLLNGGFMNNARHVVLFVGIERPPKDYISRCKELGVEWRYVAKEASKGNLRFLLDLRREIVANKSNLLFLHGLSAIPAVILMRFSPGKNAPFVLLRETQANHLKSKREWLYLALAHRVVDHIVHLTDEAAQGASKSLGFFVKKSKVTVIPNGIDTEYYKPKPKSYDNIINIGMQSRLQPNKDHKTLIEAFSIINEKSLGKKLHLHIAGDGTTFNEIEEMIEELNLKDSVTMYGMLNQSQLLNFLQNLDIYVHCTHGETMSTAIMQALSCGLPVIATDVDGVSNMIKPDAGILYKLGDANDLANKLDGLICNTSDMRKWGEKARVYALKNYAITAAVKSYHDLIPDINN